MHRLAGGFVCYKYGTAMSNLIYLFTDLPYFVRKNTIGFTVYAIEEALAILFG